MWNNRIKYDKRMEPELSRNESQTINVKPSYIKIPLFSRAYFSIFLYVYSFVVFSLLYLFLAVEYGVESIDVWLFVFSGISAVPFSALLFFSERILKSRCNKWSYSRFHKVELFTSWIVTVVTFVAALSMILLYIDMLPLWGMFVVLGLSPLLFFGLVLSNIFSSPGRTVLYLKIFLNDFENNRYNTNFRLLESASIRIKKITIDTYNLEIKPEVMALGVTTSIIDNEQLTKNDIMNLIEWIEEPTDSKKFHNFREIIKKHQSIANQSAKDGIELKHRWTMERATPIVGGIITPIVIAILVNVVPKLLEIL